eukprot:CAMPEP_0114657276 /NCGR_PEP_ID=MMETSP0191-20121206/13622_1 /TAXON_ID=126664 /ORGANISM="Sorites sp." /LENGTH=44 /DNA_ID= /DNA_START= /DNA_END= /DNA_ORIENTATION=
MVYVVQVLLIVKLILLMFMVELEFLVNQVEFMMDVMIAIGDDHV